MGESPQSPQSPQSSAAPERPVPALALLSEHRASLALATYVPMFGVAALLFAAGVWFVTAPFIDSAAWTFENRTDAPLWFTPYYSLDREHEGPLAMASFSQGRFFIAPGAQRTLWLQTGDVPLDGVVLELDPEFGWIDTARRPQTPDDRVARSLISVEENRSSRLVLDRLEASVSTDPTELWVSGRPPRDLRFDDPLVSKRAPRLVALVDEGAVPLTAARHDAVLSWSARYARMVWLALVALLGGLPFGLLLGWWRWQRLRAAEGRRQRAS